MGLYYCKKHLKMIQGTLNSERTEVEFNCGCVFKSKAAEKQRVSKKTETIYSLPNGRIIKKVISEEKWVMEAKKNK